VNVLYVNHTAAVSGGERSLLELLAALPGGVRASAATPRGPLQRALIDRDIPTATMVGTAGSLRLHPMHTPRALAEMAVSALQLRRAARSQRADAVHANSIRAGVILALARPRHVARIVHVRDCLPPTATSAATMRLLATSATRVIANSRYTASCILQSAPAARVRVVHNGVDLKRWDPARIDRAAARALLGAAAESGLLLGVVGQLTPWKGHDTAIEALGLLRADGVDARLVVVGSAKFRDRATRLDNDAYLARLRALVHDAGLDGRVAWLGEREDVRALMAGLDVLLVPSWQEPFGRALIEAMALRVPVVATEVGGPAEIVRDGREGLLVPPRSPLALARAVRTLADSSQLRLTMGRAGRARVEQGFSSDRHAAAVLDVYRESLEATAATGGTGRGARHP
jgi:glycosyltransferase involved in cell wall biosynthesis